jgi:hypothetical protein
LTLTNFDLEILDHKWDCINFGGEWIRYDSSFDNIFLAFAPVFAIS